MSSDKQIEEPHSCIERWLSSNQSVVVYVNSKAVGVRAPTGQLEKPSFSLALSHFFDRPLLINKDGVRAELLFEAAFFSCFLPWSSIWAAHPAELHSAILFWMENSPGHGWDITLLNYLKVIPEQVQELKPKLVAPSFKLLRVEENNTPEAISSQEAAPDGRKQLSEKTKKDDKRPKLKLVK
jgi:hypothetical protein